MSTAENIGTTFVENLLASGSKILENSERVSGVGLTAVKQLVDNQLELGSALTEFGAGQLKSLGDVTAPQEFLQCQKSEFEALGGKLQAYFEQLRAVAKETHQACVKLGQDAAADFGSKKAA